MHLAKKMDMVGSHMRGCVSVSIENLRRVPPGSLRAFLGLLPYGVYSSLCVPKDLTIDKIALQRGQSSVTYIQQICLPIFSMDLRSHSDLAAHFVERTAVPWHLFRGNYQSNTFGCIV